MRVALCIAFVTGGASIAHADCPYLEGGTIERVVSLGCPLQLFYPADSVITPPTMITVTRDGQPVELQVTSSTPVPRRILYVTLDRPDPETCRDQQYKEGREFDGIALEVDGLMVGDQYSTSIIGEAYPCPQSIMQSGFEQWLYCSSPSDPYVQCCESAGLPSDCYRPVPAHDEGGCGSDDCSTASGPSLGIAFVLLALRKRNRRSS